jgi:hypothetical protein
MRCHHCKSENIERLEYGYKCNDCKTDDRSYDLCGNGDVRRQQGKDFARQQLTELVEELLTKVDCIEIIVKREDEYFGKDILQDVEIHCVYPG